MLALTVFTMKDFIVLYAVFTLASGVVLAVVVTISLHQYYSDDDKLVRRGSDRSSLISSKNSSNLIIERILIFKTKRFLLITYALILWFIVSVCWFKAQCMFHFGGDIRELAIIYTRFHILNLGLRHLCHIPFLTTPLQLISYMEKVCATLVPLEIPWNVRHKCLLMRSWRRWTPDMQSEVEQLIAQLMTHRWSWMREILQPCR